MSLSTDRSFRDTLYGDVALPAPLFDLAKTPAIQRLRDIRLSNIDSLAMPGIANISRYEHALGTAYLAGRIHRGARVSQQDMLVLGAAAMLHDAGITAMAHLVEESLRYIGRQFDHERTLSRLLKNPAKTDLGGINQQVYLGYETQIEKWAVQTFGANSVSRIEEIVEALRGIGRWGTFISADIDLDNLDNLTRIAYHMGLDVQRDLPILVAEGMMEDVGGKGRLFTDACTELIQQWLDLRHEVYGRLMLSRLDFAGKSMLIFAVVTAYSNQDLEPESQVWQLTDRELIQELLRSTDADVSNTMRAWLVQDVWPLADLLWLRGKAPPFDCMLDFCNHISTIVGRPCFAYRIQDKRVRIVKIPTNTGKLIQLGSESTQWLLGVTSRRKGAFTRLENERIRDAACEFFKAEYLAKSDAAELSRAPLFE